MCILEKLNNWQIVKNVKNYEKFILSRFNYFIIKKISTFVFSSLGFENDVIYAWAWVPFTGILNIFPASKLLVPSNPPIKKIKKYLFLLQN